MAVTFDKVNRIIEVTSDASITIQQLINAIRDWEDELTNFETSKIADASGKDDLGSGILVGITLKLLNWKLKFEAKVSPTTCYVGGGNLVAVDGDGVSMFAIAPSTNVTVQLTQSTSAVIAQNAEISLIKAKTDSLPSDPARQLTVQEVKDAIGTPSSTIASEFSDIKGAGWTDETLKKLKELMGNMARTSIKI